MDKLKELLEGMDPAELMPDLSTVLGKVELVIRIALMAAPLILLGLGLLYFLMPPKEANYKIGYRCFWGMGSQEAWQFTQRLAGIVWSVLGLVLSIVMAVLSLHLSGMTVTGMAYFAVKCLLWELGLVVASILGINITTVVLFNIRGKHRFDAPPAAETTEDSGQGEAE